MRALSPFLTIASVAAFLSACSGGGSPAPEPPQPTVSSTRAASIARQTGYKVVDLGTLGGSFSTNDDVNDRGAAAGTSTLAGDAVTRGFLWTKGGLIDVGALPVGPNSYGQNVNARLQVVGAADGAASIADSNAACFTASSLDSHAFLWQNGTMRDLGTLGGKSSRSSWINDSGQIVGTSQINATDPNGFAACGGTPGSQIIRAFLYENGKMKDLGTLGGYDAFGAAINDRGQLVGSSQISKTVDPTLGFVRQHVFMWTNGVMTDLGTLGGGLGYPEGITDQGAVFGLTTLVGEQHVHAFLWQHGVMTDLGVLKGDTDSSALGENSFGQVVGFSATSSTMRAFILQNGVMTDLNTLLSANSGFQLATGFWINDAGQIAAQALVEHTGEMHAVLLTPSNNGARGKAGGAPLTQSLRKYLLRRLGYGHLKLLTSKH
jgi:probable HAF family extracellular repeat protein